MGGSGRTWTDAVFAVLRPQVATILLLGIAAGLPFLLIFSSLGLWLREAGVERSAVTFFSWAGLGYSFKFVWAPLVDRLPLPWLTAALGRRRSWLLVAQFGIISAIVWMAMTDPAGNTLTQMALAAVLLGFASATQDIVIDAYRIESGDESVQAMLSAAYIAGYRVGLLVSGAGALYLASYFGSELGHYRYDAWRSSYLIMAAVMLIGVATTLLIPEPRRSVTIPTDVRDSASIFATFIVAATGFALTFVLTAGVAEAMQGALGGGGLAEIGIGALRLLFAIGIAASIARALTALGLVRRDALASTYLEPVADFFRRYDLRVALLLVALIGVYRISDIVLGVIANVFYQDLGFTKEQIATVVKTFGMIMTIAGGFVGGVLALRFGVMRILLLGALLTVLTNLMFILLAVAGRSEPLLYVVISADNLTAGIASAAFVAFLSSLTNVRFTAVQYAVFSSLMTLIPKLLGGYSGSIVDGVGYVNFFIFAGAIGVPVLALVWIAGRRLPIADARGDELTAADDAASPLAPRRESS